MAIPIAIPRLGWNMEEGNFGGWLKLDGDHVRAGEPLFTLESEKATEEIEGLDSGFLRIPADGPKAGDRLTVGTVIGYIVASIDEPFGADTPSKSQAAPEPVASPSVRHDLVSPTERGEPARLEQPHSSPRARRAARELGVDWTTVPGSGRNGRVRERDVRAANRDLGAQDTRIPITPIRRTIATRMLESLGTTAPVTLTTTVDATALVNLRNQLKSAGPGGLVPSFTDLFVKLAAGALVKHPLLGAQWTDRGIKQPEAIHVGIAVDTDAGLLVPVVRDVPSLDLRDLAARTARLIERARAGQLTSTEMTGGCFTITNLGAFGIDAFTPIINPPECAVLGIGRIAKRPAVVEGAIVPRDTVTLSLTFDHRIVDGGPAAQFLQTLAQAVENPAPWINLRGGHEE